MVTDPSKLPSFSFHTEPYSHQREDFERSKDARHFAFFWEMGTGKTKPILDTAVRLFLKQEIDGVLVVSDKGCYLNWYYDQVPKHVSPIIPTRCAYWSSSMTRDEQRMVDEVMVAKDDVFDILCINVESLAFRGYGAAEKFLKNHYAMMIVDESTSIKNYKAQRTKAAIALGQLAEYRRIATGTPITQSPLDLFGQCEFLSQGLLGYRSFVVFKSQYAVVRQVIQGTRRYETVEGYVNLDKLTKSIQPFSSRRLKSECLDLPEKVYETYYVEQTPEQRELYKKLKQEAVALFDSGAVTITSALTMLGKLHQINCGHIRLDQDGGTIRIPCNRGKALLDLLSGISGKVVIWGHYQEDIRIIDELLRTAHGPGSCVTYYGQTDAGDRSAAITRFRDDVECRFFVGTPATGGKGLNGLTVASHAIYYSNHYKLEARLQSEDRIHRIGQVNRCTYTDLIVPKTVDVEILQALRNKQDLATSVLDKIRELFT